MLSTESLTLLAAGLLVWIAIVHLPMAFGVRNGSIVWSGRYPRRLSSELRRRSLYYSLVMIASAWVLASIGGVIDNPLIPEAWHRSAGLAVAVFLVIASFHSFRWGSTWERVFFGPITLFGATLAVSFILV